MKDSRHFLIKVLLIVISALLFWLAMPGPYEIFILGWVAVIPIFFVLSRPKIQESLILGFLFGFIYYGSNSTWLINIAVPAWLLLTLFYALMHFPIIFFGIAILKKNFPSLFVLNFAAVWVAGDWVIRERILSLPFFNIAESQYKIPFLLQISGLAGIYFLSFIILITSGSVFLILEGRKRPLVPPEKLTIVLTVFLLLLCSVYGINNPQIANPNFEEKLSKKIVLIQPNFLADDPKGGDIQWRMQKLERLTNLALDSSGKSDLVVWPEGVLPLPLFREEGTGLFTAFPQIEAELKDFVRQKNIPLLFGTRIFPLKNRSKSPNYYYNSMVLLSPDGSYSWYMKRYPVLWAEYLPDWLSPVKKILALYGYAQKIPGKKAPLFQQDGFQFSVLMCSENGLYSFAKNSASKISQGFIINPTNDADVRSEMEIHQHSILNRFRSVENDIYIAGAGNVGQTELINPKGEQIKRIPPYTDGFLTIEVPLRSPKNQFFPRRFLGELFLYALLFFLIVQVAIIVTKKRQGWKP